ncbi:MAG: hypothetical protein PHV60_05895 [bacterium]|nr:hypothetical protein [bacterium]
MKRIGGVVLVVLTSIVLTAIAYAMPVKVDGTVGGGLSRYMYTNAYGVATSISPLNLNADVLVPLSIYNSFRSSLYSQKTLLVTPVRENRFNLGYDQNLFPLLHKQGQVKLDYNFRTYGDRVLTNTDYTGNVLNLISNVWILDTTNLRLNYEFYNKKVDDEAYSYKHNNILIGTDVKLRDLRDLLKVDFNLYKKDVKVKDILTRKINSFDQNALNIAYTMGLPERDEAGATLHLRNVTYDQESKANNRKELGLGAYYQDERKTGSLRWGGEIYTERYPNDEASDFDQYEFTLKNSANAAGRWRSRDSKHKVDLYNAKPDTANDYMQWLWDLELHSYPKNYQGYYLSNGIKVRHWDNNDPVSKFQHFAEDIASAGLEWSSFSLGSLAIGPVLGHRWYVDPNRKDNAADTDDSLWQNPANYFLYGARLSMGLYIKTGMNLNVFYEYKNFLNYEAKPNKFTTELSDLRVQLANYITDVMQLSVDIDYTDNTNDNGIASIGNSKMSAQVQLQYHFSRLFK